MAASPPRRRHPPNRRSFAASKAARSTTHRCPTRCGWRCRTGCCRTSTPTELRALLEPAPLDLRVNLLKATREEARAALAAEGLDATPTPHSPWGLRIEGRRQVTTGAAFRAGPGGDPGRGQPTRRRPGRCTAGHARRRPVRGRRRQDAGAGDDDAEPRPACRLRRLRHPAGRRGSASSSPAPASCHRRPAHRSATRMPGRASTRAATSWLPSSWISTRPERNAAPVVTWRRPSMRRPQGESGVGVASRPSAASAARASSRVAFSRLTRRSSGAGSSRAPVLLERRGRGSSQSGTSSRTASGIDGWSSVRPSSRRSAACSDGASGAGANGPGERFGELA